MLSKISGLAAFDRLLFLSPLTRSCACNARNRVFADATRQKRCSLLAAESSSLKWIRQGSDHDWRWFLRYVCIKPERKRSRIPSISPLFKKKRVFSSSRGFGNVGESCYSWVACVHFDSTCDLRVSFLLFRKGLPISNE